MKINYIQAISARSLTSFVRSATEVFPDFTTINTSYAFELNKMKNLVQFISRIRA